MARRRARRGSARPVLDFLTRLVRRLLQFLRRLLERLGLLRRRDRRRRPSDLPFFTVEVDDMANVRLRWTLPEVALDQRPIKHVAIDVRIVPDEGEPPPWSRVNEVSPPATELLIEQIGAGRREFRGVVVDAADEESPNPRIVQVDVPFRGPSDLVELTATLE